MGYLVVENFKYGLDARRSELTSKPGTLVDLVNAHITDGGEVEKRKAFTKTDIVSSIDPTITTKGFQEGADGIYVFGNRVDPGGWPAGIKYQLLQHPVLHATDTTYIPVITVGIDTILCSTVFAGKIFVVAKFVNGNIFAYYDSVILKDLYDGRKLSALQLNTGFLADLLAAINASGVYTGDQPVASPTLNVYGPSGQLYDVSIVKASAAGTLTSLLIDSGVPGVSAVSATGSFQIASGTEAAGHQITQVAVGATNLLLAPVPYNDSPERTAADVAVAISTNSVVSGYRAFASGKVVVISAVVAGITPNTLNVVVTSAIDVCISLCKFSFIGTGFTLDYIHVDGINILTAALLYPTPVGESITDFCSRIKANINANSGTSGYLANSVSNSIFLSKLVTSSADVSKAVSVSVTPTGGTGTVYTGDVEPFLVTLDTTHLGVQTHAGTQILYSNGSATATPTGGVPPFLYSWRVTEAFAEHGTCRGIVQSPYSQTTSFTILKAVYSGAVYLRAVCTVTDSLGRTQESPEVVISG
jgi:hypothetical protein